MSAGNHRVLSRSHIGKLSAVLLLAFLFRLAFGLSLPFWPEDQFQTYLLGLKFYTTGHWPWYGPDLIGVETTYTTQIPGALEGLVIGLPFFILPIPEAPFILLNILSLSALGLLAWYCSKKVPSISPWFIFLSLVLLPWTLQINTGMITEAWCLFGSVLFFIGFFETLPGFRLGVLSFPPANALMGFAFFWYLQFHLSSMYLAVFGVLSMFLQWKSRLFPLWKSILFFILGALPTAAFLLPTLVLYGLPQGHNGGSFVTLFNVKNVGQFFTILARWLALPGFELPFFLGPPGSAGYTTWGPASGPDIQLPAFIGPNTGERLKFLMGSPFLLVPGIFLWVLGIVQPVSLLVLSFFKRPEIKDWPVIRGLALFTLGLIWMSFWFTVKRPLSHIYYDATFPVVFLYSLYCWSRFSSPGWRTFAKVYLAAAFIFQAAYAWRIHPAYSLYTNREKISEALNEKNYQLLGDRRPNSFY